MARSEPLRVQVSLDQLIEVVESEELDLEAELEAMGEEFEALEAGLVGEEEPEELGGAEELYGAEEPDGAEEVEELAVVDADLVALVARAGPDEFTCSACYLIKSRRLLADPLRRLCRDCSAV